MNACELAIDLQCLGLRVGEGCDLEGDARSLSRTRAGLGSGLELVLPGGRKDIWINAPVAERFAAASPWTLRQGREGYAVHDARTGGSRPVRVPPEPAWYRRSTRAGTRMSRVGVLQGTYLGIYVGPTCRFWGDADRLACRFCTTGVNVGSAEAQEKSIEDVVETARAARDESGVTFVHLNSGFQGGKEIATAAPYVAALKERVGVLVGVQATPSRRMADYDRLRDLGVDHVSFCFEFRDPEWFARLCPGKEQVLGQRAFLDALAYAARLWGPGRVSGEIIAGVEPIEQTLRAIDEIVAVGAFPTVCIFRPLAGSAMADHPPPRPEEMRTVFRRVAEACRDAALPVGIAPNVEVSLIVQPDDALDLLPPLDPRTWLYRGWLGLLRAAARPALRRAMATRPAPAREAVHA